MKQMFVFLTYYVKTLNSVATGNKNTFSTGEHYLCYLQISLSRQEGRSSFPWQGLWGYGIYRSPSYYPFSPPLTSMKLKLEPPSTSLQDLTKLAH